MKTLLTPNKSILLLLLAICFPLSVITAQTHYTDSLEALLEAHPEQDTVRVRLLNETAYAAIYSDIENTLNYAREADNLSDLLNFTKGKAESIYIIGVYYAKKSEYSKAKEKFRQSLKLAQTCGDTKLVSKSYNNIGIIYDYQGNYPMALEYYQKTLNIETAEEDTLGMASTYCNIGSIYGITENYPLSLDYFNKSLNFFRLKGDTLRTGQVLGNIGIIYKKNADYSKALECYQQCLETEEALEDREGMAVSYNNIADLYLYINDYRKAEKYFLKGLELSEEIGRKISMSSGHIGLCQVYMFSKKYKQAIFHGEEAYRIAYEIGQKELMKTTSGTLAELYAKTGNFRKAYNYHFEFKNQSDSLINEKNIQRITALEYEYKHEQEKKEAELKQQKKDAVMAEKAKREKIVRYFLTAGIVLLIIIVFIIWRNLISKRKSNVLLTHQKEEIQKVNEELKKTLTALKDTQSRLVESEKMASIGVLSAGIAHEINNPLNFIQGGIFSLKSFIESEFPEKLHEFEKLYVCIDEGIERASSIVTGLDHFTEKSDSTTDNCDINQIIDNCLSVLRNEYENKIEIKKDYSNKTLNFTGNESRLHQLMLNILLNAIQSVEKKGIISIFTKNEQDTLIIKISDTGHGIKKEHLDKVTDPFFTTKEPGEGVGLGLSIAYNIVKEHKGNMIIESEENEGTRVKVVFPLH